MNSRPVRTPITPVNTTGMDADDTAAYLQRQLTGGNRVEVLKSGRRYVDYDTTVDLALALRQAGKLPGTTGAISSLMAQRQVVDAYAHGAPYENTQARYAGPLAKLSLLLALSTKDATGNELVGELAARIQPDGRITDQSKSGDQSDVTSQAYGVLALTAAGRTDDARRAADALMRQQCGDGSFPAGFQPAERRCQTGDVLATALVVQALNAKHGADDQPGPADVVAKAVHALDDTQDVDGAWVSGWQQNGRPNVAATAKAVVALQSAGVDTTSARQRLTSAIRPDGGLPMWPGEGTNRAASTAALPALAGGTLLTADKTVLDRGATAPFATTGGTGSTTTAMTDDGGIGSWPVVTGAALLFVLAGAVGGWMLSRRRPTTDRSSR